MKLTKIYNEVKIVNTNNFYQMVKDLYNKFGIYVTEALIGRHYNNINDYIDSFGLNDKQIQDLTPFYNYFSEMPSDFIKSKIQLVYFNKSFWEHHFENVSSYKSFELWYHDDDDFIYAFHNNNKPIFNKA